MLRSLDADAEAKLQAMLSGKFSADKEFEDLKPYVYNRLTQQSHFRILLVLPGTADDPLKCLLLEETLAVANNKYLALSYAWGDATPNRAIMCNGGKMYITSNLRSALGRLRQPEKLLPAWCDALCIDQGPSPDALRERENQVALMSQIFSGAMRVIADLGPGDENLHELVEAIQMIVRIPEQTWKQAEGQTNIIQYLDLPAFAQLMWRLLEDFLSRPWFRRVWCVQEVVLARDVRVLIGNYYFPYRQISLAVYRVLICHSNAGLVHQLDTWDVPKWNVIRKSGLSTIRTYDIRLSRSASTQKSLCDLFDSGIELDSTDPRDKIYALYGMVENSVLNGLSVSYSEPLASLAQRVSDYLIRKGHAAYMLSHAGGPGKDCSSWCLDVNGNPETNSFFLGHSVKPNGTCATYSAGGSHSPKLRYGLDNTVLLVSGFVSDGIASMTGPFPVPVFTDLDEAINVETLWTVVEWLDSVLNWYSEKCPGQCDNAPLWRTIIADCNATVPDAQPHHRNRASAEFGANFEELLQWKVRLQNFREGPWPTESNTKSNGRALDSGKACTLLDLHIGNGDRAALSSDKQWHYSVSPQIKCSRRFYRHLPRCRRSVRATERRRSLSAGWTMLSPRYDGRRSFRA